uniref:ATP synthase F0 subunit 8 n=1 Tax=Macrosteles quadrimaculatus TaxID=2250545 RepID=A0A384ZKM4_9HEMI|nr:ATP synthase F0 subunit 8 [Macrosteles quadrimaculatus]AWX90840.1 ATP synthase F0 subunit 8 [Macrosteles quadrimaculatus]
MPQMAPMWWTTIMISTIIMMMLMIMNIYFTKKNMFKNNTENKIKKINWKW